MPIHRTRLALAFVRQVRASLYLRLARSRRWRRRVPPAATGLALLAASGALFTSAVVLAGQAHAGTAVAQAQSIDQVLTNVRNLIMGVLAALATVCLMVAGVRYVLGAGDPASIEKAKTAFRAACLGYLLAILAPLVVSVLKQIAGA